MSYVVSSEADFSLIEAHVVRLSQRFLQQVSELSAQCNVCSSCLRFQNCVKGLARRYRSLSILSPPYVVDCSPWSKGRRGDLPPPENDKHVSANIGEEWSS